MGYCKGRVVAVHQGGGCWEVVVAGEHPGAFLIDNLLIWPIVEAEGADWVGREVEYAEGMMRFLDAEPAPVGGEPVPAAFPRLVS